MQVQTIIELTTIPRAEFPDGVIPVGTVLDNPGDYKLVRHGCAVPLDDEAAEAADMTPEAMARAQAAYPKTAAGLQPEDHEAWDKGYMRGYNPDGSWIPGPNAAEYEATQDEEQWAESPLELPPYREEDENDA